MKHAVYLKLKKNWMHIFRLLILAIPRRQRGTHWGASPARLVDSIWRCQVVHPVLLSSGWTRPLLPVLVVAGHVLGEGTQWRRADAAGLARTVAHHLGVDCAGHAVVELRIELGQHVRVPDAGLRDVAHGGSLHDVADDELLDCLVLGHAAGAVGAAHGLHMAAIVLVASSVTALLGHLGGCLSVGETVCTAISI